MRIQKNRKRRARKRQREKDKEREKEERERTNSRERNRDTGRKKRKKFTGKKIVMCFMEKLFVKESLFFLCTVSCHMWEVNKAGTPPKNICHGL